MMMNIQGKGFHQNLKISIKLDEKNKAHDQYFSSIIIHRNENEKRILKRLQLLFLLEIEKNSYYFDYYDLEYRTGYPAKKITVLSRNDFIPYEMIGNTTFQEEIECKKSIGIETALNLLTNQSTEFLGLELFSPNFKKTANGKYLLDFTLPIHFNYQQAVNDHRKYIKIHLHPLLTFIQSSINDTTTNNDEDSGLFSISSSFPEVNRLYQWTNLGNERPFASNYYQQLADSIENSSYQLLSVSPFCKSNTSVLIPVGNVSDHVWVSPITSFVTISCLLVLIIKVLLMIRESVLIIHKKAANERTKLE